MKLNFCNVIVTDDIDNANCITHSGTFHADEVFATAFLSLLFDKINVCRVNEVPKSKIDSNAIIYDVGLGELDHHQAGGNGKRENGVMYAACGLVWRKYGRNILSKIGVDDKDIEYVHSQIDKDLIQFIDANDNGITPAISTDYNYVTVASIIASFNPIWNENINANDRFYDAVKFAKVIVENFILKEIAKSQAKEIVEEAIKNSSNRIMILDRYMPWKDFILNSSNPKANEILYVVFPSNRGGYNVYTVPKEHGSFENRKSLPKEWSGLRDEELQKKTGVKTARFCHIACFICTAETKEDALELANLAVKY